MDVRGDDDRSSELERAREPSHSRRETSRITPARKDDLTGVASALLRLSRPARPALEGVQMVGIHTSFETTDAFRALLHRQLNSGRGQGDSFHASLDV